jgi:hypothetical protein
MQTTHRSSRDLGAAKATFNAATVSIGGLYLATQSVAATLIGTAASTALTCWVMWLAHNRNRVLTSSRQPAAQVNEPETTAERPAH